MITPAYLAQARCVWVMLMKGFALPIGAMRILPPLKVAGRQHHGKSIIGMCLKLRKLLLFVSFSNYSRADWVILSTVC
jgi:hypothetical protein